MTAAFGDVLGGKGNVIGLENENAVIGITPNEKLKKDLKALVAENDYDNSIRIEEDKRGVVIHILDNLLFASGNSDLSKGSLSVLHRLAGILKKIPNDIRVEGHTDNVPISSKMFPSNWHLSVSRALNTAYYLISEEKLSPDRVSIVGYSEYKPIETNNTVDGRRVNRRVDIVIINEKQENEN
jgi:chemotaxis protein MotB